MKIIKKLSEHIEEEIHDAEGYARWALEVKEEYPHLADTLYTLSLEEMKHMEALHKEVVSLIEDYRKNEGEPPAAMLAVYDYLHERQIDEAKDAKTYQAMYKER